MSSYNLTLRQTPVNTYDHAIMMPETPLVTLH